MRNPLLNRVGICLLSVLSGVVPLAAQDIPLRDWTLPSSVSEGLGKQVDASPPRAFIGLPPCRLLDTRAVGAPPDFQGPIYGNGEARNYVLWGHCGLPAGADAVSVNFTVTGSPSAQPGAFLLAFPTGSFPPPVSTLNYQAGQTVANAAIVPLSASGSLTVNVSHSTHVLMDINGYFSDVQGTPSNFFRIYGDLAPFGVIVGENAGQGPGVHGINNRMDVLGIGLRGTHAGVGVGVWGEALAGSGTTGPSAGVHGVSFGPGRNYGVFGRTLGDLAAAGVFGMAGTTAGLESFASAGVRGEGWFGVLGLAQENMGDSAVSGILVSSVGGPVAQGSLGRDAGANLYGVFSFGDYGGNGAKYFVEPHPRQADLVIRYVALEGPESGTYFRGRGKFQNGMATIEVPEDFAMVTDEDGLSVQITPIGEMASFAVIRAGLDRIVVKGSRNVEFYYLVNGVRRSHKHLKPVGPGREYMPDSPDATMPAYLTDVQKQMLIENRTYKADGTVNMETARALGWEKAWEKRARSKSSQLDADVLRFGEKIERVEPALASDAAFLHSAEGDAKVPQ